jgi:bifunctional NMN adenylyltransferase/nudix hydrolase
MKQTAVLIARFQTPSFPGESRQLLHHLLAHYAKVVVVLRVAPVRGSRANPLDFPVREAMLKEAYPTLPVLALRDHPSAAVWSEHLEALLAKHFPGEEYILFMSPDATPFPYTGTLPVQVLPFEEEESPAEPCGEDTEDVLPTEAFRRGIRYAYCRTYARVNPTVDVALLDGGKILLGKKKERDGWRLPGGFADPGDESFEAAAVRELREECGAVQTAAMRYIGSARIDDWRYRTEADKVLTLLFATTLLSGMPQAGDDLAEVGWFDLVHLEGMLAAGDIAEEHHVLIRLLLDGAGI